MDWEGGSSSGQPLSISAGGSSKLKKSGWCDGQGDRLGPGRLELLAAELVNRVAGQRARLSVSATGPSNSQASIRRSTISTTGPDCSSTFASATPYCATPHTTITPEGRAPPRSPHTSPPTTINTINTINTITNVTTTSLPPARTATPSCRITHQTAGHPRPRMDATANGYSHPD